jgi:hypothetical protein
VEPKKQLSNGHILPHAQGNRNLHLHVHLHLFRDYKRGKLLPFRATALAFAITADGLRARDAGVMAPLTVAS